MTQSTRPARPMGGGWEGGDARVRCRACESPEMVEEVRMGDFLGSRCKECQTLSFYTEDDVRPERYARMYSSESSDEQFDGSIARLRLRCLQNLNPKWVPPPRLRTTDRLIVDRILNRRGRSARVLDVGCGSGRVLQALARNGAEVMGVEVTPSLVGDLVSAGIPAVNSDGDGLPSAAVSFRPQVVLLIEVLEHLDDPQALLRDIRDRCPRAELIVSVPSPDRRAARRGEWEPWDWPPNHLTRFSVAGLSQLLESAGYEAQVLTPRAGSSDAVPTWWRVFPSKILAVRRSSRRTNLLSRPQPESVSDSSQAILGLAFLWIAWAHERLGRVLGALRQLRGSYSADSIVGTGVTKRTPRGEGQQDVTAR